MHKITEFVLKRPVTTFLVVVSLIFFGFMSITNQKMELMSDIEMPMMIVTTTYAGASPEDVDKLITKPIEDGVSVGCEGGHLPFRRKLRHDHHPV